MSDFDGSEREIVPGALRGYRAWRYDGMDLGACNFDHVHWSVGRNEATCHHCEYPSCPIHIGHDVSPNVKCTCGFYATHLPTNPDYRGNVIGVVKAYGKVILGTLGFRAQYAEIEALTPLYIPSFAQETLAQTLAAQYKVPVFLSPEDMREQFPPISVKELLPEKPKEIGYHRMQAMMSRPPSLMSITITPEMLKLMQQYFLNGDV